MFLAMFLDVISTTNIDDDDYHDSINNQYLIAWPSRQSRIINFPRTLRDMDEYADPRIEFFLEVVMTSEPQHGLAPPK